MSAKYVASSNELLRLELKQSTAERRIELADFADSDNWRLDWNCATVNQIAAHLITENEMQDEAIKPPSQRFHCSRKFESKDGGELPKSDCQKGQKLCRT